MSIKRYSLRTLFVVMAAICFILGVCEFGYRPGYCELRTFVWVRCGPFCVDYSQATPGFDRSYGPQVCLQYKHHRIYIPKSCYRGPQSPPNPPASEGAERDEARREAKLLADDKSRLMDRIEQLERSKAAMQNRIDRLINKLEGR